MNKPPLDIAGQVAIAGTQYAEERWMRGETAAFKDLWRKRIYDAIFAGIIHAIDLHEKDLKKQRKSRQSFQLLWCQKCRAQLRVPRVMQRADVRCRTCGNVQDVSREDRT